MKNTQVDDTWSVDYDDHDNDRPKVIRQHSEIVDRHLMNNFTLALFYAFLVGRLNRAQSKEV